MTRSHLKKMILVKYRGGAEFSRVAGFPVLSYPLCGSQPTGILEYFEDLKRGTNPAEKGGRPKDFFEVASIFRQGLYKVSTPAGAEACRNGHSENG